MARALIVALMVFVVGCATNSASVQPAGDQARDANQLLIIDCLLPGQVRKLGTNATFLTPRRPVKTSSSDCEIRGGEYTSYDRSNYATALKIWLPLAKDGDPAAQTYVGEIYEKGLGLEADYQLAAHWYQKAADQRYSRAMINLGYLYEGGLGVNRDLTAAMNWYRKASGLSEGNLEFVSSVEVARREATKREKVELEQEVTDLRVEVGELRTALDERQGALKVAQRDAANVRNQLAAKRRELAAQQQTVAVVTQPDPEVELALNRKLDQASKEQQRLIAKLAGQQLEAGRLRQELDLAQQASGATDDQQASLMRELEQARAQEVALKRTLDGASKDVTSLRVQLSEQSDSSQRLEAQLADAKQEQSRLTRKLSGEQLASKQKQKELELTLETRKQEVQALQQSLAAADAKVASTGQSNEEIKALEAMLAKRQQEVATQQQELTQLQAELDKASQATGGGLTIEQSDFAAVIAAAPVGPTIEIIDPPLAVMRGTPSVLLRSISKDIDIIGKVDPVNDVLSFRLNDAPVSIDQNGLFTANVPLQDADTPVRVVAVDKAGNRSSLDFMIVPKAGKAAEPAPAEPAGNPGAAVDFGTYHALVIGNNNYENLTNLRTAHNDANAVASILKTKYGFNVRLLLDADRYAMLSALNDLRESLTEKDNLLIYYAGHGELDEANTRGHWLPVDAEPNSSANWISNVAITDVLNALAAKHVFVVADSCYSGALTRSSVARLQTGMAEDERVKWYKTMAKARSRVVLTSGDVKPVLDSGGGEHSVFAKAFLDVLRENNQILEGYKLYRSVQKRVKTAAAALEFVQDPQFAPIKYAGHEAGEFFFQPSQSASIAQDLTVALLTD